MIIGMNRSSLALSNCARFCVKVVKEKNLSRSHLPVHSEKRNDSEKLDPILLRIRTTLSLHPSKPEKNHRDRQSYHNYYLNPLDS